MSFEILRFVLAVVSHWQSYVTGGVVTGFIAIIERLTDWKLSKRMFAVVFLGVFLLVSFFLAWRDQYREALRVPTMKAQIEDREKQIASLKASPAQIQVNLPPIIVPPSTVVVQPAIGSQDLTGVLQLDGMLVVSENNALTHNIIAEGKSLWLNVIYRNSGTQPIHHEYNTQSLWVVDMSAAKAEQTMRHRFTTERRTGYKAAVEKWKGGGVGVEAKVYQSVTSGPLTKSSVDGIMNGSVRLYVLAWATWKDSHNRTGEMEECHWLQTPSTPELTIANAVWHTCEAPQ